MTTRIPVTAVAADGVRSINAAVFNQLTDPQLAWLAIQSIRQDRSALKLLLEMQPILVADDDGETTCIEGWLPHCGLYGAVAADGSTHT